MLFTLVFQEVVEDVEILWIIDIVDKTTVVIFSIEYGLRLIDFSLKRRTSNTSQTVMQSCEDEVLHPADEPDRLPLPPPLLHLPRLHRPRGLQRHWEGGKDYPIDQGERSSRVQRAFDHKIYEMGHLIQFFRLCAF